MRNKQVEFNPYIYTLSELYRFGYEISVFNTKHPVIILRGSLFVVTPVHVASSKNGYQFFSYVYRSRKHWKCKYFRMKRIQIYFYMHTKGQYYPLETHSLFRLFHYISCLKSRSVVKWPHVCSTAYCKCIFYNASSLKYFQRKPITSASFCFLTNLDIFWLLTQCDI